MKTQDQHQIKPETQSCQTSVSGSPFSEVYLMDCMDLMAKYPDNYFDLAVVDPPYGIGMDNQKVRVKPNRPNSYLRAGEKQYNTTDWDSKPPDKKYFEELFRVSKNQIIWGGNYVELPATRCFLIWDKVAQMDTMADCEFAWTSFDRNAKIFRHVRNTSEKRIHITQKPIKLYKWILQNYAKIGDKILDTHLGSQSSRIACYDMGFDFYGWELDKEYFEKGNKRFEEFKSQLKLF